MVRKFAADPNAPKCPISSYFLFMQARRPSVVANNPELKGNVAAVAKLIGERYRQLTPEELSPYKQRAAELKEDYNAKMAEYKKTEEYARYTTEKKAFKDQLKKNVSKVDLKKMQPSRPKKSHSAYLLYTADQRPMIAVSRPGLAVTEQAKLMGASWKILDAEKKAAYHEAAAALKAEYDQEIAEYMQTDEYKAYVLAKEAAHAAARAEKLASKKVPVAVKAPRQCLAVKAPPAKKKAAKAIKPKKAGKPKKTVKKAAKKVKTAKKAKTAKKLKKTKKVKKTKKAKKTAKKSAKKTTKKRKATKAKAKKPAKKAKKSKKAKKATKKAKKATKKATKKTKKAKKAGKKGTKGKKKAKKVKKAQK